MGGQDVGEGPEQLLVCERAVTPFPPFRKESGDNRFQAFEGRTEFRQAVQAEVEKTRRVFFLDNKQVIRSSSDACGRGGSAPRLSDNGVLFQKLRQVLNRRTVTRRMFRNLAPPCPRSSILLRRGICVECLRTLRSDALARAENTMNRNDFPAREEGLLLTHFIVVSDVKKSREFYTHLLEAEVLVQENPAILKAANSWIIMNPGGPGTPDKPEVTLDVPTPDAPVSSFLNVRVADIEATRERLRKHGIEFLTDPWDRGAEIRAYVGDPDGHLIEIGEATGILQGIHAG